MSSSRHGGASDLSVNNLEFFEDRIHKSKDLCIYPTPAYFNNIHKMPIASDCEERMVEESPMIYIGEEDIHDMVRMEFYKGRMALAFGRPQTHFSAVITLMYWYYMYNLDISV